MLISRSLRKFWAITFFSLVSLSSISMSAFSEDSTIYVRLNANPFAAPYYIFSTAPNGESISVSLEKGSSHTFIRTDDGHPFNIGDAWRDANVAIDIVSNGTGTDVAGVASISGNEQLTITIPENFSEASLFYYCFAHSDMISTLEIVANTDSNGSLNEDNTTDEVLNWDFDKNGATDALTDGLLLLRYAFGIRGDALTNGAVAPNATILPQQIESSMSAISTIADIDGNGQMDALTDGLLLLRYLFGLTGTSLIEGAVATVATRNTAELIEQYINTLMPGQTLAQALGLLIPMKDNQEFSSKLTQSYESMFGLSLELSLPEFEAMPVMDSADSVDGAAAGASFTTTYTLEATIDEHDFVKYDGENIFIAPSYSMYESCCIVFDQPIALVDDAIEVGEEPVIADELYYPIIPEQRAIKIMGTNSEQATVTEVGTIAIEGSRTIEGLYTSNDQLTAIESSGWWGLYGDAFNDATNWRGQTTGLSVYDISDATNPALDWELEIEGGFVTSRKKGDILYLVARHTPTIDNFNHYATFEDTHLNDEAIDNVEPADLLPKATINGEQIDFLSASDCMMINADHELAPDQYGYPTMTLLVAVNIADKTLVNSACYLESTSGVYVSQNAIYFIQTEYSWTNTRTLIHSFNLSSDLAYRGSGEVEGSLFGSGEIDFRINEHDGHLRVVSSQWTGDSSDTRDHMLTVLKASPEELSLEPVAVLPNAAYPNEIGKPNEDLYGVRFFGDTLYLVTFERTDPLYVLDLTDHTNPIIAGELEVTGFSDFLHPVNDDLLLGLGQDEDGLVKLELFNVASIENPVSLSTTSIGLGSDWSHSPARYNRHAFTYQQINESTDRFSVPVSLSYSSSDSGYVQEDRLYLFNLFNKDQSDMATFMSSGYISGGFNNFWNNDRQRAFFHGNSIFYVNGDEVIPSFWQYPED